MVEHVKRSHPVSLKPSCSMGANDGNFDPACVCSRCGKKFASKAYVDAHERTCDGMFVRQPKFTQSKVSHVHIWKRKPFFKPPFKAHER